MASTSELKNAISDIYATELGRSADAGGLDYYLNQALSGRSLADIKQEINASGEGKTYDESTLRQLYQTGLGREADVEGLNYWLNQLQSGKVTTDDLAKAFYTGALSSTGESTAAGRTAAANQLVDLALEQQLGKDISAADKEFVANYTNQLLNQGVSVDQIANELNRSTEGVNYDTQTISAIYRQQFGRDAEQEGYQYWVSRLQDEGYTAAQAKELIKGGAVGSDVAAMADRADATAAGNPTFRNVITSNVFEADPYGGRYYTANPYDLSEDAVNVSTLADGTKVQWNAPVNQNAKVTGFDAAGNFTVQNGVPTINAGEVNAAVRRAVSAGTLTDQQAKDIATRIERSVAGATNAADAANVLNNYYDILNDYTTNVAIDPRYGIQTGQGATRDIALTNYEKLSNLIGANNTLPSIPQLVSQVTNNANPTGPVIEAPSNYRPTDLGIGDLPSSWTNFVTVNDDGTVTPITGGTYTGPGINSNFVPYDTRDTTANVVTPENYRNTTLGLSSILQRPMYTSYAFNRARPTVVVPQTYSDRALLGERAPGGVDLAAIAQAAPAPFGGEPAAVPRPVTNISTPEGMAQPIVEQIMADRIASAMPAEAASEAAPTGMKAGGQVQQHGLKSLAKELASMGRGGDTMLAHINPQEAQMLKAMGGSGTINPHTGLPEFLFGFHVPIVDDAIHLVEKGLSALGPLAPIIGGIVAGPAGAAVAGSLSGGHGFDLKRGIMSGVAAWGAGNLMGGLEGAANAGNTLTSPGVEGAISSGTPTAGQSFGIGNYGGANTGIGISAGPAPVPTDAISIPDLSATPTASTGSGLSLSAGEAPIQYNQPGALESGWNKIANVPSQLSTAGEGIKNLYNNVPGAMDAFKGSFGAGSGAAAIMGTTGVLGIDAANKYKDEQQALLDAANEKKRIQREKAYAAIRANPWSFAEGGSVDDELGYDGLEPMGSPLVPKYNGEEGSEVEEDRFDAETPDRERHARLRANPMGIISNKDMKALAGRLGVDVPVGDKATMSAGLSGLAGRVGGKLGALPTTADVGIGGKVGPGYLQAQLMRDLANRQNRYQANYTIPFAKGGETDPRFLSGGGDGMSDSIPATIGGKQEARLADGEFVVPADVVSHLGNGSSKAGAKRLYSMMDKVRKARTGTKKQGKQINAMKYLPA